MSETYDRIATGERLRKRRIQFGFSREEVAERIGKAAKYYADIERGSCGMSVETMMALAEILNLSMDYITYGIKKKKQRDESTEEELTIAMIRQVDKKNQKYLREVIKAFATIRDKEEV